MDPSIHSVQKSTLEILFLITPWIEQGNKRVYFHHIPDSKDYMFMRRFLASYHDVHSHEVVGAFLCWGLCPQQHV